MSLWNLSRSAFGVGALVALLSGCAQSTQAVPSIGPPSSMLPDSKDSTLIYISSKKKASVYVYNYPKGNHRATIIGFYGPEGLCGDAAGDVWVTDIDPYTNTGYLDEYAHGGKQPIATLEDPDNSPQACAVDPTTGDLAVADSQDNIAIYPAARAPASYYSTQGLVDNPTSIVYDGAGNVYVAGSTHHPAWLPAGASTLLNFSLKPSPKKHGPLRWDGQYLTVLNSAGSHDELWRYELLGNSAKRVDSIELECCIGDYAIGGSILGATVPRLNEASVITYPPGGRGLGLTVVEPTGIAFSATPAQK